MAGCGTCWAAWGLPGPRPRVQGACPGGHVGCDGRACGNVDQFVFMDVRMAWKARQVAWNEARCMAWKEGEGHGMERGRVGSAGPLGASNYIMFCVATVLSTWDYI